MNYTLEQKQAAVGRNELWWRYPGVDDTFLSTWTRVADDLHLDWIEIEDLCQRGAEYHIGPTAPTPPRVLSELEGELLEALKELADCGAEAWGDDRPCVRDARAVIQKAEAQQ